MFSISKNTQLLNISYKLFLSAQSWLHVENTHLKQFRQNQNREAEKIMKGKSTGRENEKLKIMKTVINAYNKGKFTLESK